MKIVYFKSVKAEYIPVQQTEFTQVKLIWEIMVDERGTTYKILKLCHVKWEFLWLKKPKCEKNRSEEKCVRVNAASSFLEIHKYFFLLEEYHLPLYFEN